MKRWFSWLLVVCLVAFAMPAARMEAESTDSEVSSMPVESEIGEEEIALAAPEPDGESGPAVANTGDIPIDAAHFPDAAFRSWVEWIDLDEDGWLSTYERDRVASCTCQYKEIESIQGIEYFANLKRLYLGGNRLKTLTISGFSQLESVECGENPLETLVLSQLPALVRLSCHTTRLTVLDVGGCARLCDLVKTTSPVFLDKDTLQYIKRGTQDTFIVFDANVEIKAPGLFPATPTPGTDPTPTSEPEPTAEPEPEEGVVELSADARRVMYIGDSLQIRASGGTVKSYKSSKSSVASVSKAGLVTAKKAGAAKITVTMKDKTKRILTLEVRDPYAPTGISLGDGPVSVGKGGMVQLRPTMTSLREPAKTKLKWKSSTTKVASVDKNGQVTGKKAGEATVTVTTDNKLTASIVIQVTDEQQFSASALDQAFLQATNQENLLLRKTSALLSQKVYCLDDRPAEIEAILGDMGFHDFVEHAHTGSETHGLGYLLAYKDIDLGGSVRRVFAVVCRGTRGTEEWISNATWGEGEIHEGFDAPARRLAGVFSDYMNQHREGVSDFRVWITGHSRGAAVANLLAGQYMGQMGVSGAQVYCYTFACPNVKKGALVAMNNIFNYNIGGDVVPRVPFEAWGYHRYGRTPPMKNTATLYKVKVIDNKTMDKIAANVGSLTSGPVSSLLKEALRQHGAPNAGVYGVALMEILLKMDADMVAGPSLVKAIKASIFVKDAAKALLYAWDTHSMDTYMLWMSREEKKKLIK